MTADASPQKPVKSTRFIAQLRLKIARDAALRDRFDGAELERRLTPDPVEAYLEALGPATRATMNRLRGLARAAHPGLTEHLKWNAPSFALAGEHRITLGLTPSGEVRVVMHRGAKVKDSAGFTFADPDGLADWPAVDRGVMVFADEDAVARREAPIADVFRRWLAAAA